MSVLCDTCDLKSRIKKAACYENPENPSFIDLILTNHPKCCQISCEIKTSLPDFHRITVTVMETT